MTTTQQDRHIPNPTGAGGFADNPQNRNPGGWKKDESISYQYNRLIRMSPDEFDRFVPQTIAQKIALKRVQNAYADNGRSLDETKEITDRIEGKAPQTVTLDADIRTNSYEQLTPEELRKLAGK